MAMWPRAEPRSYLSTPYFHPHVHVLAAAGVFRVDGVFVELPPSPAALLEGGFRRAVLDFLVAERASLATNEHARHGG